MDKFRLKKDQKDRKRQNRQFKPKKNSRKIFFKKKSQVNFKLNEYAKRILRIQINN